MKRRKPHPLRSVLLALAAGCIALALLLEFSGLPLHRKTLTQKTEAHFIDVGQGDATLLLSGGQAILIDAGEADDGDLLIDYLTEQGVKKLFAVVATHPHADHIGGMADVVDAFPIENFYMGTETSNTTAYRNLLRALENRGIHPLVPAEGDSLELNSGATLTFLGPADDVPADNLNNRSIICRFRAGDRSVLLMGDAEDEAEQSLLRHEPFLSCEVLRVGHHGSGGSSSLRFLRAIRPAVAVISCASENDYGHPHPETLKRLSQANIITVHITANEGTVVLPLDSSPTSKENAA